MSEAVQQAQARTVAALSPMRVVIKGRCERVRRHENRVYTTVITPAADEYSRPSTIEVRSAQRFAEPGEMCQFSAVLGGYAGRSYDISDKSTGERRTVHPCTMTLDLVE
ncbi:MAG: single-stranded DNA-binding protein [Gammaproteobacteria bacterium]|jgi:hypothetical protein|nr:single-stranded DNA-binding protein [Gammaproteobacteria bacterium]MBK9467503.1 single-stranded DNA-binding protein [Gammaproteobacteria bacterium]